MKIILLGAPGAGKGTVAEFLAKEYNFLHISTGNIFRQQIKEKTPLGVLADSLISKGEFVPDDITCEIVQNYLKNLGERDIILDGFPRTIYQAQKLQEFAKIDKVILVDVPNDIIINRISSRRICENCGTFYVQGQVGKTCPKCNGNIVIRDDDKSDVVSHRLNVYTQKTEPLINFYAEKIIKVDNSGSEQHMQKQLKEIFKGREII